MNNDDFIKIMGKLDWSTTKASGYLGVTRRTIFNYKSGNRPIPLCIEKFLFVYLELKELKNKINSVIDW